MLIPTHMRQSAAVQGDLAGKRLALRPSERLAFWNQFAIEFLFLAWLELIVLDWLWSRADPYPYRASVAMTGAAIVGFLAIRATVGSAVARVFYAAGALAALVAASASTWQSVAVCITCAASLLAITVPPGRWRRANYSAGKVVRAAVAALVLAAVAVLVFSTLLAPLRLAVSQGSWLGNGLGSALQGDLVGSPSDILAVQWGAGPIACLLLLVLSALYAAGSSLFAASRNRPGTERTVVAACAAAVLADLFLSARAAPAFLTTDTTAGTCALAFAIAATAIASKAQVKSPLPIRARRAFTQSRKIAWVGIGVVTISVFLIAHFAMYSRVVPYLGAAAPSRYADFAQLSTVSQPTQDATIAMEDGHFYQHHGFDWVAMHRALRVDIRKGRIEQGGSTISQQLAKNLFLGNDRTVWRKLEEAAYTVELEHDLSKRRILELYVNTIDYGYGSRGIAAAARYYFHTTPAKLTLAQSAVLVGLVPAPPKVDPAARQSGEPQYEDLEELAAGEQTALGRITFFFPDRYSDGQISRAQAVPLDRLVYPYKDAWDRGATDALPARWRNVYFYSFVDPDEPTGISNVSRYLEPELAGFLDEAHKKLGLTGIDHLGVYNDRTMRQSASAMSAHAYGQAIDISGFRFAGGARISVKDHADPKVLAKLAPVEALLKRHFDIVVDWHDDPLRHQTHFHCEVRGPLPTKLRATALRSLGRPPIL